MAFRLTRRLALTALVGLVAACASSKFKTYNGPPVTQIIVQKRQRTMMLLSGNRLLKTYRVGLGTQPVGHKQFEGDGKTPEGWYMIDRRNPNSRYHLSLGVSYPNTRDAAYAQTQGLSPGGDIFIHGRGPEGNALVTQRWDWTVGCIAVSDEEAEEIYSMVKDGTPILITA